MRLAFICDGPIFKDIQGNYYEYAYHNLMERYSLIANEITYVMRVKPFKQKGTYSKVPKEVRVVSVPDFKSAGGSIRGYQAAKETLKSCVENNDVFVLRLPSMTAEMAIPFINKQGKPYMVEMVGCAWDSYWNHSLLGKFVAPVEFLRTRRAVKRAPFICYVTSSFLQRRYPSRKTAVTTNCSNVELGELNAAALSERHKRIDSMNNRKIVLGTAAAIDTRYKGQEYVIKAIPYLLGKGIDVEYLLAGGKNKNDDDTYLVDLAKSLRVNDRVKFLGALSASEMPQFYDNLDVYVQPSKQEGLPRAVIEAFSRGCPAAGTNIAGIPELVQGEFLFEKNSVKACGDAIIRVLAADLHAVANRNFKIAGDYCKTKIDARRRAFYDAFKRTYSL